MLADCKEVRRAKACSVVFSAAFEVERICQVHVFVWLALYVLYMHVYTSHGGVASATHSLLSKAAYTALRSEH